MDNWLFSDPERCNLLRKEAAEWAFPRTPFRPFSMAKGTGGGVDCAGLWQALHEAAGVAPAGRFNFLRKTCDYSSASSLARLIRYVRGQVVSDPQSGALAILYAELDRKTQVKDLMCGDVAVMRQGGQFHVAILTFPPRFVNALPNLGVVEGNIDDFTFADLLVCLFRARKIT